MSWDLSQFSAESLYQFNVCDIKQQGKKIIGTLHALAALSVLYSLLD